MEGQAATSVLVVGPAWVGDMVMSHVLLRHLHASRPGVGIDVLAPPATAPLVDLMPEARRVISLPVAHGELGWVTRKTVARQLRSAGYDQAIVLPNSLKSALVPWLAKVPLRTGWRGEMRYGLLNDLRVLDRTALPTLAERFLALGVQAHAPLPSAMCLPQLRVDAAQAHASAARFQLREEVPLLGLCPGAAFGSAKQWPPKYFATLANHYLAQGWQVALLGAADDHEVCAYIHEKAHDQRHVHNLAGASTLPEAVHVLAACAAVVSNDSGLMHIAAALGRPLVAIYGPTSPAFTPPLHAGAQVVSEPLACAPCFARECPLSHHRCMREIDAARVIAVLDELLAAHGSDACASCS